MGGFSLSAAVAVLVGSGLSLVVGGGVARADFLTTVHKGLNFKGPTAMPSVVPPALGDIQAVAARGALTMAAGWTEEKNQAIKPQKLSPLDRQVLRKHLGNIVDEVQIVYGAQLLKEWPAGASKVALGSGATAQAVGSIIYVAGKPGPAASVGRLTTIARLVHRSAQFRGAKAAVPFETTYMQQWSKASGVIGDIALEVASREFLKTKFVPWLKEICGASAVIVPSSDGAGYKGRCQPVADKLPPNPTAKERKRTATGADVCSSAGQRRVTSIWARFRGRFTGRVVCVESSARLEAKELKGRVAHGFGTLRTQAGTWTGRFRWGMPVGTLLFVSADGERLYGPVDPQGKWHGAVMLPSALGFTRYVQYKAGVEEGPASLDLGKAKFRGTWKAGLPYEGDFIDVNGSAYTGRLCKGAPCGRGKLKSKSGTYDGRWRKGQPHGLGGAQWFGTDHRYHGAWAKGRPGGVGKMWVDFDGKRTWTYNGSFKAGLRGGKGTLSFDTCKFTGTWVDGRLAGETSMACDDFEYTGGVMGSGPHGRGSLTLKADGSRFRGRFHLGTLIDGLARWPVVSKSVLAKFLADLGAAVYPGYVLKRLYYKGKFRGVAPYGPGVLTIEAQKGEEPPVRLVLAGEFDKAAAGKIASLGACKEVKAGEDWKPLGCSKPWISDGERTSPAPVFP